MSGMLSFIAHIGLYVIFILSLAVAGTATFIIFSSIDTPVSLPTGIPSPHAPTILSTGQTPGTGVTPAVTSDSRQASMPTVLPCPMPTSPPPLAVPPPVPTSQLPGDVYRETRSVIDADDGGHLMVGGAVTGASGGSNWDFYVAKTDQSGNELWAKTYGGAQYDYAWDIQSAGDGGFVIVGGTESYGSGSRGVCLFEINAAGNMQWLNTYGDGGGDERYALRKTGDGGYIVLAVSSHGHNDQQVVITDRDGRLMWSRANVGNSSNAGDPSPTGESSPAAGRGQSHNK